MANTVWDEWRAASEEYAERCWSDYMFEQTFDEEEDADEY